LSIAFLKIRRALLANDNYGEAARELLKMGVRMNLGSLAAQLAVWTSICYWQYAGEEF